MFNLIINPIAIALSISTACGVFVHDMKMDKFAMTALALPAFMTTADSGARLAHLTPELHTHAERTSLSQAVTDLRGQTPRVQPRTNDDKKHLMQRYATRGTHSYDTYHLPLD